jgi:hypothetical protein
MTTSLPKSKEKKMAQASEILDAIGQENESEGIKWTQYFMNEFDKKQWEQNQLKQDRLEKVRRFNKAEYYRVLTGMFNEEVKDMDIPTGYLVIAQYTKEGIVVNMMDRWKKKWRRAFTPDGTPKVDFNAIVGLLTDVQNTIDILERQATERLKEFGLVLPT